LRLAFDSEADIVGGGGKTVWREDFREASMTDPVIRRGRCLCGGVQIALVGEPNRVTLCHCVNCQKTSGSAFSVIAVAPIEAVTVTGKVGVFVDRAESGNEFERCFCPGCGSPVESRSPLLASRGVTILKASLFDDTSWLRPESQIWCISQQDWLEGIDEVPRYDRHKV
jgi:hypothetical protein